MWRFQLHVLRLKLGVHRTFLVNVLHFVALIHCFLQIFLIDRKVFLVHGQWVLELHVHRVVLALPLLHNSRVLRVCSVDDLVDKQRVPEIMRGCVLGFRVVLLF